MLATNWPDMNMDVASLFAGKTNSRNLAMVGQQGPPKMVAKRMK